MSLLHLFSLIHRLVFPLVPWPRAWEFPSYLSRGMGKPIINLHTLLWPTSEHLLSVSSDRKVSPNHRLAGHSNHSLAKYKSPLRKSRFGGTGCGRSDVLPSDHISSAAHFAGTSPLPQPQAESTPLSLTAGWVLPTALSNSTAEVMRWGFLGQVKRDGCLPGCLSGAAPHWKAGSLPRGGAGCAEKTQGGSGCSRRPPPAHRGSKPAGTGHPSASAGLQLLMLWEVSCPDGRLAGKINGC